MKKVHDAPVVNLDEFRTRQQRRAEQRQEAKIVVNHSRAVRALTQDMQRNIDAGATQEEILDALTAMGVRAELVAEAGRACVWGSPVSSTIVEPVSLKCVEIFDSLDALMKSKAKGDGAA